MSERWCCHVLHDEFGPMDLEELCDLAEAGTLGSGDLVRRESDDVWTVARKCQELRPIFAATEAVSEMPSHGSPPSGRAVDGSTSPPRIVAKQKPLRPAEEPVSDAIPTATVEEPSPTIEEPSPDLVRSPRERLIAWSLAIGLLLVLTLVDRTINSVPATFPQPRRVREQLTELHWFLATGPWSGWEWALLWFDSAVILFFTSTCLARRFAR